MKSAMRRMPCASTSSASIGPSSSAVASGKSAPRRLSSRIPRQQPSSGKRRVASAMKSSENCTTRPRSGTPASAGTSLTQLCGRFGPVSTRLPGSKLPMKSPTK